MGDGQDAANSSGADLVRLQSDVVLQAWVQQSVWSQVADGLRRDIVRSRAVALALTLAGAVLSAGAFAFDLGSTPGKVLACAGGIAVGFAGMIGARVTIDALRDWTRARSVSEAIKSDVFLYLAGVDPYAGDDAERALDRALVNAERSAADLVRHKEGVQARARPLPPVQNLDSYIDVRIRGQRDGYYLPRAAQLRARLRRFRQLQAALGAGGVVVGAVASAAEVGALAVWIPVIAAAGAAVTAHTASSRYEYLLLEYLRTAEELDLLADRRGDAADMTPAEVIRAAEHVISVQNEAWMAKLTSAESTESGP